MKMFISFAVGLLMAFTVWAGTSSPKAQQSLNHLNDQFNQAAAEHDAEGLLGLYSNSPVWIEQGKPASVGIEGPRALFEFVTANKGLVTHTIDHLFVSDDDSLAVMIGSVEAKIESKGMDATGTYLFVLKPGDEDWKIVVDMWHQHNAE